MTEPESQDEYTQKRILWRIRQLVEGGADINARDDVIGKTALDLAVSNSRMETVETLCSWGGEGSDGAESAIPFQHEVVGGHATAMTAASEHDDTLGITTEVEK